MCSASRESVETSNSSSDVDGGAASSSDDNGRPDSGGNCNSDSDEYGIGLDVAIGRSPVEHDAWVDVPLSLATEPVMTCDGLELSAAEPVDSAVPTGDPLMPDADQDKPVREPAATHPLNTTTVARTSRRKLAAYNRGSGNDESGTLGRRRVWG